MRDKSNLLLRLGVTIPTAIGHSAVRVADEGKWYLLAAFWIIFGWVMGVSFVPSAFAMIAIGYMSLMWTNWKDFKAWLAHQEVHKQMPKGLFQMDKTHWSVEKMNGETVVIEMPPDFDIKRDGPFPLIQHYAPELMECLNGIQENQNEFRIQIKLNGDEDEV